MAANDFVVGLDCGTSYVKATAKTVDGKILGHSRLRSPSEIKSVFEEGDCFFRSHQWWIAFEKVIRNLKDENELQLSRLRGICISGITPTLTVFDAARPEDAFSIPYWYIPSVDIRDKTLGLQSLRFRKNLTRERIRILKTLAASRGMKLPCVTDLVGYLNWYLTGILTINSIALAELGLSNRGSDLAELQVKGGPTPRCAAPLDKIAVSQNRPLEGVLSPTRITVCCGCADTVASIVGGGPQLKSELMIYLGTFGSLLRIDVALEIVLTEASLHTVPYTWLLSVPRFGSTVEGFANRWFPRLKREHRLARFDEVAKSCPPGAMGTLFLLPRWDSIMRERGTFRFIPTRSRDVGIRARSVLESLGYASRPIIESEVGMSGIWAAGGGSRSSTWISSLAEVTRREIMVRNLAWEAVGTADLAARAVTNASGIKREIFKAKPRSEEQLCVEHNAIHAREFYDRSH